MLSKNSLIACGGPAPVGVAIDFDQRVNVEN